MPERSTHGFSDVAAIETQTVQGADPAVATALANSGLGSPAWPVQLDAGTISLSGPIGRQITQAVARTVFTHTDAGGLRYTSPVDATEECWAVFDTVAVWVSDPHPLDQDDADLHSACAALDLRLQDQPT